MVWCGVVRSGGERRTLVVISFDITCTTEDIHTPFGVDLICQFIASRWGPLSFLMPIADMRLRLEERNVEVFFSLPEHFRSTWDCKIPGSCVCSRELTSDDYYEQDRSNDAPSHLMAS